MDSSESIARSLAEIARILDAAFDREKQAIRLYDVERQKVYQAALAPEVKEKFGMAGVQGER